MPTADFLLLIAETLRKKSRKSAAWCSRLLQISCKSSKIEAREDGPHLQIPCKTR